MLTSDYLPHKIYAGLYILLALLLQHLIKGWSNPYPSLLEFCFDLSELWTRMQYWFNTYFMFYWWIISKIFVCSLPLFGFLRDFRAIIAGMSGLGVFCQMCCLSACGFTGTHWWLLVWEAIRNFCPALYGNFFLACLCLQVNSKAFTNFAGLVCHCLVSSISFTPMHSKQQCYRSQQQHFDLLRQYKLILGCSSNVPFLKLASRFSWQLPSEAEPGGLRPVVPGGPRAGQHAAWHCDFGGPSWPGETIRRAGMMLQTPHPQGLSGTRQMPGRFASNGAAQSPRCHQNLLDLTNWHVPVKILFGGSILSDAAASQPAGTATTFVCC